MPSHDCSENLFTIYYFNSATADFEDSKPKRAGGGSVGLFPFPRVGRSDPDMISEWELPISYNSFENYDGNFSSEERFVIYSNSLK